jgi:probable HAF family extracellular repeat protein
MNKLTTIIFAIPIVAVANAQTYHVTDLGTVGGTNSRATAINSSGQVVGYSQNSAGQLRAFLYSGGSIQDLGANGGVGSTASAINDSGQIVGDYTFGTGPDPVRKGFSYTSGSGMHDIGSLGGAWNEPYGLNNAGQIVGISNTGAGAFRAYVYNGSTYTNLGTLGGNWSYAIGINDSGVIVGDANTASEQEHGFRFSGGVMTDLGTLPPPATNGSTAYAINASGQIAGYSYQTSGPGLGFIVNGTTLTPLGALSGHGSLAHGINSAGVITGASEFIASYSFNLSVSGGHGFYWSSGTIRDLNSMVDGSGSGWTITEGNGINGNGLIAGSALNSSGVLHAVLLTPVPEPATLSFVSLAFAFVALRLPRRRLASAHTAAQNATKSTAPLR